MNLRFTAFGEVMCRFNSKYREITCSMPDEAPITHNKRAYQIAHGQGLNSLHAMLEILTFLLSNNMMFIKLGFHLNRCDRCVTSMLEAYWTIGSSSNCILSSGDRTIQAVLDEGFPSIIRSGRLDLLKTLAACDPDVKTRFNRPIPCDIHNYKTWTPIEIALNNGNVRTSNHLLLHGARSYVNIPKWLCLRSLWGSDDVSNGVLSLF